MDPNLWNEQHRPGTPVWAVDDEGKAFLTVTSCEAAYDPEAGVGVVGVFGAKTARRLDQVVTADESRHETAHRHAVHLAGPAWTWTETQAGLMVGRKGDSSTYVHVHLKAPVPVAGLTLIVGGSSPAAAVARLAEIAP